MYTLILALVIPVSLHLPDFLRVGPLVHKFLLPGNDAIVSPLVPVGLTGDGLPPSLLDKPQFFQDVDVVPLEAITSTDVSPLPRARDRG